MATIRKRNNSYQIRVSCGYNVRGEQITKTTTWKPAPNMTKRQIKKELERQAVLFEEKCRSGVYLDGNIKLADYIDMWFADYEKKQLKIRTIAEYKRLVERIKQALGHISLDRIQPHHLMEFYSKLAEEGVRKDIKYRAAERFEKVCAEKSIGIRELADMAGVSRNTVTCCRQGKNISRNTADKIMRALGDNKLFIPVGNTTLSNSTIAKYHTLLSSMLSTAVQWQMIFSNPCERVAPPKKERHEEMYLDEVQALQLIKCLDREPLRYRTAIMLLLYSGMRRGELCGLTWHDTDLEHNLISITKSSLYLPEYGVFDDTTKNKSSERVIQVPKEMTDLLKLYQKEQNITRLSMGDRWTDSDKIFTTQYGAPMHPDTLSDWFKKFIRKNNLPDIHLHSLRHTNATLLIASGTNIRMVAKRLGHSTPTTTGNIYAHAIKTADEMAAEKLANIFNPIRKAE